MTSEELDAKRGALEAMFGLDKEEGEQYLSGSVSAAQRPS